MSLALSGADAVFAAAAIGAAAGQGRLLVAVAATVLTIFVLEIRHIPALNKLDSRHWTSRFNNDEAVPPSDRASGNPGDP